MRYCTPDHFEKSPFPVDGGVSHEGLEAYLEDVKYAGLVPKEFDLRQAQRLDLVREVFKELAGRRELGAELERAQAVTAKYGL